MYTMDCCVLYCAASCWNQLLSWLDVPRMNNTLAPTLSGHLLPPLKCVYAQRWGVALREFTMFTQGINQRKNQVIFSLTFNTIWPLFCNRRRRLLSAS